MSPDYNELTYCYMRLCCDKIWLISIENTMYFCWGASRLMARNDTLVWPVDTWISHRFSNLLTLVIEISSCWWGQAKLVMMKFEIYFLLQKYVALLLIHWSWISALITWSMINSIICNDDIATSDNEKYSIRVRYGLSFVSSYTERYILIWLCHMLHCHWFM